MEISQKASTGRPYGRKLTEKRRIQNRAAQRTYREKRKERLAFLEKIAEATQPSNVSKRDNDPITEVSSLSQSPLVYSSGVSTQDPVSATRETNSDIDTANQTNPFSPISTYARPDTQFSKIYNKPAHRIDGHTSATRSSVLKDTNVTLLHRILLSEVGDNTLELEEFAHANQLDLKTILLAGFEHLKSCKSSSLRSTASTTARASLWPSVMILDDDLSLPNPLTNGISLRRQLMREAFHENACVIGISLEDILHPDCSSPFNNSSSSSYTLALENAIPPDLRPTPSQIQIPHHAFIDLIPFPWFRDRVIAIGSLVPPAYDRKDFKKDILNDGLVCWKSRARSAGQPWDRRSWEAAPWFLKKWGWLIEENGQVEEQSKWWRQLRGE